MSVNADVTLPCSIYIETVDMYGQCSKNVLKKAELCTDAQDTHNGGVPQ